MPNNLSAKCDDMTIIPVGVIGTGRNREEAIAEAESRLERFRKTERYGGFVMNGVGIVVRNYAVYYALLNASFTRYAITRREPVKVITTFPFIGNQRR